MGKKIITHILNSLRIIAFWMVIGFLFICINSVINELNVNVSTVECELGEVVDSDEYTTTFRYTINGNEATIHDIYGYKTGDTVTVIVRDGTPFVIADPADPGRYISIPSRIMYAINYDTHGDYIFVLIPYILLLLVTIKSRRDFRREYPVLTIVTHIVGALSAVYFYLSAFYLYTIALVVYGVLFFIIWLIRIITHNKKQ